MGLFRFKAGFAPIMGFVGVNGAGKSASAVATVWNQAKRTGAPVYSNISLDLPGVKVLRIEGLSDVMKINGGHVLWDDVASVAPARTTSDQPPAIVLRLGALRHYDSTLIWTSPVMEDVDVLIRRVTWSVVAMRPLLIRQVEGQLWPNTRVSFAAQYDTKPTSVTEINGDTPVSRRGFVRIASLPLDAYDTREDIELQADHAICPTCGLKRRAKYCKDDHTT